MVVISLLKSVVKSAKFMYSILFKFPGCQDLDLMNYMRQVEPDGVIAVHPTLHYV